MVRPLSRSGFVCEAGVFRSRKRLRSEYVRRSRGLAGDRPLQGWGHDASVAKHLLPGPLTPSGAGVGFRMRLEGPP